MDPNNSGDLPNKLLCRRLGPARFYPGSLTTLCNNMHADRIPTSAEARERRVRTFQDDRLFAMLLRHPQCMHTD